MKRALLLLHPILLIAAERAEVGTPPPPPKQIEHSFSYVFDRFPAIPDKVSSHSIASVGEEQKTIELNDGSQWDVSLFDRSKLEHWNSSHHILVTQNTRWSSSYRYRLVNQELGNSVEVILSGGPWLSDSKGVKVKSVGPDQIELSDGTHLEITESDLAHLSKWTDGDALILGFNSGNDRTCETLLVNVRTNTFIQARVF